MFFWSRYTHQHHNKGHEMLLANAPRYTLTTIFNHGSVTQQIIRDGIKKIDSAINKVKLQFLFEH